MSHRKKGWNGMAEAMVAIERLEPTSAFALT